MDAQDMIASMDPRLTDGIYIFCSTPHPDAIGSCLDVAMGMFVEKEGHSFIVPIDDAARLGYNCRLPMRLISLNLYSQLDAVGLTAAIASELAAFNISCNVVAAYHHDHIFIPEQRAIEALDIIQGLQRRQAGDPSAGSLAGAIC